MLISKAVFWDMILEMLFLLTKIKREIIRIVYKRLDLPEEYKPELLDLGG